MPETTKKGYELAGDLLPYIGETRAIVETCSLITRHATTYARIQEAWCNDEMSDRQTARMEERERRIEARITRLVEDLPNPDDGVWRIEFQGDPRGWTVRLHAPDGREIGCDR